MQGLTSAPFLREAITSIRRIYPTFFFKLLSDALELFLVSITFLLDTRILFALIKPIFPAKDCFFFPIISARFEL